MSDVTLVRWAEGDLDTLRRCNTPEMTAHLGDPETPEALERRHARYLEGCRTGASHMYRVVAEGHPEGVGSIGFWPYEHHGTPGFETGWAIETAHQGRGFATSALLAVVAAAREQDASAPIYAFPRVANAPSNAICRKAGFALFGQEDFEYPKGHVEASSVWVLEPEA